MTEPVHAFAQSLPADALPAYIYDLAALREHARHTRSVLPDRVELYYAAKANPEQKILTALAAYVDGYEVSSGGELAHVSAALPDHPLAFGGPGKTPAEIEAALAAGVDRFHVESEHELRVLGYLAARSARGTDVTQGPVRVLLRFNLAWPSGLTPSVALAMGGGPSPFGLDPTQADAMMRQFTDSSHPALELLGVHAHLGSGLAAPEQLAVARSTVEWAEALFARHGVALREVNVGGGMHVDYTDPCARFDWTEFGAGLARVLAERPNLRIRIEPGRALTAYCGWYAAELLDVKTSHGKHFAVVRGGTHHLRTPAAKGHDQPCTVLPVEDWPHPWPRPVGGGESVTFVGQLCTPKDVLARNVRAPELRAGDRVAFAMAGAYAWNISHHEFLMHPAPEVHFLGG
ncbi:MAG TPA: type III PLP-dependent enzyme [Actinocrinis sp.]|nr:type III PLP-dependent enzyme [Actinocrinis sp.]